MCEAFTAIDDSIQNKETANPSISFFMINRDFIKMFKEDNKWYDAIIKKKVAQPLH
jgi:hypothetical protein